MVSEGPAETLILSALQKLDGEHRLVPGAQLAATSRKLAEQEGLDFSALLKSSGLKFGDIVRTLVGRNSNLRLEVYEGSDFLIGYVGAEMRTKSAKYKFIRKDFYEAFTFFNRSQSFYNPGRDEISNQALERSVAIPIPTQDLEIETRINFAKRVDENIREQLMRALEAPNNLATFSGVVLRSGLSQSWHEFNYERLSRSISDWATSNSLVIKKDWFDQPETSTKSKRSSFSLQELFSCLTEDELAMVSVPASLFAIMLKRSVER